MNPPFLIAGLRRVVNAALALDPEGLDACAALSGRVVVVEVLGLRRTLVLTLGAGGIDVIEVGANGPAESATAPDAVVRGTPLGIARAVGQMRAGAVPSAEDVVVEGDAEVVRALSALARRLDPDPEEALARVLGDAPAHQVGRALHAAMRWAARARESVLLDAGEYLREEAEILPPRRDTEAFAIAVEDLRDRVERLERRLERIEGEGHGY